MTSTGVQSMGRFPLDRHRERPRDRLQLYLRGKYAGPGATKRLAMDIEATPKTAENILDGHWPSDLHFAAIVRRFGQDIWDAVFLPDIDETLARLREEERHLDHALQAARSRRLQVEGRSYGAAERVEAAETAGRD